MPPPVPRPTDYRVSGRRLPPPVGQQIQVRYPPPAFSPRRCQKNRRIRSRLCARASPPLFPAPCRPSPAFVMDDLAAGPPARFAERGERAIAGISDPEQEGHLIAARDTQDARRLFLITHRRMTGADPQVGV